MTSLYHVDAFTDVPFKGNPAAVCLTDEPRPDSWMSSIAVEMNLSETAFLHKEPNGYGLRWFTPRKEVSLCGHATLASAHILWEEHLASGHEEIAFSTMSGVLSARWSAGSIELDFPARLVEPTSSNVPLNRALGLSPKATTKYATPKGTIYLLELENEVMVRELTPDFKSLAETDARAVIVTAGSSSAQQDFVSRYFAPAVGIDEDPVTGSAHCCLAPYWSAKLGKIALTGYQASQRGGFIKCRHVGERVFLQGNAITIFKAELAV
jgi:PhzF family phenazine biosynthesis protein